MTRQKDKRSMILYTYIFFSSLQIIQASEEIPKVVVPGAGGSGPFEVVKDWISAFESKFPEADFSISSVGSGAAQSALWGGINCVKKPVEALCEDEEYEEGVSKTVWGIGGGTIDADAYKEHEGLDLQQLPALGGPVMLVYSKDVTDNLGKSDDKALNLTLEIMGAIFNETIQTWNHPLIQAANPNLELPDQFINTVVRRDKSGMSQTITEALKSANEMWPEEAVGKKPKWPLSNITLCSDSSINTCATSDTKKSTNCNADGQTGVGIAMLRKPYSCGYLELGYYRQLSNFVGQAHISSPSHPTAFQPANPETIGKTMDGLAAALDLTDLSVDFFANPTPLNGFPITRYVYWYLKKHPSQYESCYQAWLTYKFIEWSYTDPLAAEIAVNGGWIVPPPSVVDLALRKLNEIQCFDVETNGTIAASSYVPIPYRPPPMIQNTTTSDNKIMTVLVPILVSFFALLLIVLSYMYMERKKHQADSVWSVKINELSFDDPPEIIGRGTFGQVILAEYRGTQVAVKRVIPKRQTTDEKSGGGGGELQSGSNTGTLSDTIKNSNTKNTKKSLWNKYKKQNSFSSKKVIKNLNDFFSDNENGDAEFVQYDRRGSKISSTGREPGRRISINSFGSKTNNDGENSGAVKKVAESKKKVGWAAIIARRFSLGDIDDDDDSTSDENNNNHQPQEDENDIEKNHNHQDSGCITAASTTNTKVKTAGYDSTGYSSKGSYGYSSRGSIRRNSLDSTGYSSKGSYGYSSRGSIRRNSLDGPPSLTMHSTQSQKESSKHNSFYYCIKHPFQTILQPHYKDEYSRLKADFIVEMRHLSKLRHPCITTVMGAVIEKNEEPMLVMEYMDHGSLFDLLHNETMIMEGELLLPILRDIAQGVRFLHAASPKVIHGDLKAQNVLVDSKFRAKVADFGLSQKKKVGATGTPFWMAPELLRGETENNAASDVYSFGIILYEVYSRKIPYEGESYSEVIRQVCDPTVNKRPPVPPSCPPQAQILMNDCLVGDPEERPTIEEIDVRLKNLAVESIEPGEMHLSYQMKKDLKAHRTDKLLSEVFPPHIAEALRDGRKVEPESREIVTIFFSDIVGFTDISSTLSPIKISDMLDRLYEKFDELSHKHDVFKVETIGDAYMAVTNLVKDQPDHTKRIAEFSIEALATANQTLIDLDHPERGCVNIRVGFHSGPVVANVVGRRNPRYCLFGDTVNTSSRMESNSKKNRIHCSERAAKLLVKQCPTMKVKSRGGIQVKGKGEMKTYWVNEGTVRPVLNRRGSGLSICSENSSCSDTSAVDMATPVTAEEKLTVPTDEKESVPVSDIAISTNSKNVGEFAKLPIPIIPNDSSGEDDEKKCDIVDMPFRLHISDAEAHIPELGAVTEDRSM